MKRGTLQSWIKSLLYPSIYLFVIIYPILLGVVMWLVNKLFGDWVQISVGVLGLVGFLFFIRSLWRFFDREEMRFRNETRDKYRRIFRVVSLPTDQKNVMKPEGAEIRVGDYGWEAQPFRKNDLVYLQGLTEQWLVVWHAGFRPDEIEYVEQKPLSQYDWHECVGRNGYTVLNGKPCEIKKQCPFPVQARKTLSAMGFPRQV